MELKHKKIEVIEVDYFDLQEFIAEKYGVNEFLILESANDTTHRVSVKKDNLTTYDAKDIEKAINRGGIEYYMLGIIMTDLCNKDLIDPGIYNVNVSW